jgi:hypothetical protein
MKNEFICIDDIYIFSIMAKRGAGHNDDPQTLKRCACKTR